MLQVIGPLLVAVTKAGGVLFWATDVVVFAEQPLTGLVTTRVYVPDALTDAVIPVYGPLGPIHV